MITSGAQVKIAVKYSKDVFLIFPLVSAVRDEYLKMNLKGEKQTE